MFSTRSVHSNDIEQASFYMWNRSHVEGQVRPFNLFGILYDWASEMAKLYSCVCMIDKIHLSQLIRCAKIPNVKCQRMFTFHYKSEWKQNKHGAPLKRILFWFYNACAYLICICNFKTSQLFYHVYELKLKIIKNEFRRWLSI